MIHQPSGGSQGKASDMEIVYKHMQKTKDMLTKIYSDITGKDYSTVLKDMDRDNYMSAAEAMNYGLIDQVLVKH